MLGKSDLKRLETGAHFMRRTGFIALLVAALFLLGMGVADIWLAKRLAGMVHASLWDILGMHFDLNQSYSGALVRAADRASQGVRFMFYGLGALILAFTVRAQARFYARLLTELRARNA
jgi:hypothetical protein